jgi:hypothetical protein
MNERNETLQVSDVQVQRKVLRSSAHKSPNICPSPPLFFSWPPLTNICPPNVKPEKAYRGAGDVPVVGNNDQLC